MPRQLAPSAAVREEVRKWCGWSRPIRARVTRFGAADPGASPGLPPRTARLAPPGGTARRVLASLRARRSPYQPAHAGAAGQAVTAGFAAPVPLGLLDTQ